MAGLWRGLVGHSVARDWIIRNQLGRRNLTPTQWTYLMGLRYNLEKKEVPNPEGVNQHDEVEGQNVPKPTTAERLAEEYGVDESTLRRAGQFAEAVDSLKPHVPDIQERVMNGMILSLAG